MAGHYLIGGDPGGDFYASPGDPLFYFHHGMLDRIWWIWQMQDPENRIRGSNSVPGMPAAPPMDHGAAAAERDKRACVGDEVVDLGWTAGPVKLMDLNEQLGGLGGELCYVYH
ncbi:hypothetical protein VTK26DRAFT_2113 [Humicola hyalothermophila]